MSWIGVKRQIADVEEEIKTVQKEVDYCKDYRDVEQHKNKKRINLLEADIDDMEASFQEMKCTLQKTARNVVGITILTSAL